MMICRNRSKALMADQKNSLISPKKPISTFLGSPRILNGLLTIKSLSHAEIMTIMSPTSTLNSSNFENPFGKKPNLIIETKTPSDNHSKSEPKAIGLALIDSLIEEKSDDESKSSSSKPINRMGLFGSKLKVQIPSPDLDFGIKTNNEGTSEKKGFNRQLSLKEMELSEDYTCVITHGPKPKTTHIFDNCIVECCCGGDVEDLDPNIICIHMVREEKGFERDEWACEEMEMDGTDEKNKVG